MARMYRACTRYVHHWSSCLWAAQLQYRADTFLHYMDDSLQVQYY